MVVRGVGTLVQSACFAQNHAICFASVSHCYVALPLRNCHSVDSILISLHYIPVDCQPTTCRLHLSTLKLPSTSLKTASYLKNTSRTLCPKVVHKIVSKLSFFIDSCSKQFMGAMADPRVYIRNVMFEVEKWHMWNMLTEHWGLPDPHNVYLCKKGKWREGKMCSVFLTYKTIDECRTVIQHLNGQYFCSAIPVEVALADPPPGKGPQQKILHPRRPLQRNCAWRHPAQGGQVHLNNSAWDVVLVICAFGHIMLLLQSFHFASCVCWGF